MLNKSETWGLATYKESKLLFSVTQEVDDRKNETLKLIARTLTNCVSRSSVNASFSLDNEDPLTRMQFNIGPT